MIESYYPSVFKCKPSFPIVVDRGFKAEIWTKDGRRFLDFSGAATSLGQAHPKVVESIKEHVNKITGFSGLLAPTEPFLRLGEELKSIVPIRDASIAYATTGSEASDFAIQLAKYVTKRSVILSFFGAYHGLTGYALMSSPTEGMRRVAPRVSDTLYAPYPNCLPCKMRSLPCDDCVDLSISFIEEEIIGRAVEPEDLAAIIVEPLQSHGGIIFPPARFFQELRRISNETGALLIVDEVYTGFGRTGKWFGIEHHGVEPDIMVMGKGMGGGLPIAAVAFRGSLLEDWYLCSGGSLGTFAGHYLSAVASLATIEAIREENLIENSKERGEQLSSSLREFVERYDFLVDSRGTGCVQGIEFYEKGKPSKKVAEMVKWALFDRGLLAIQVGRHHNVIKLTPPITITEEQMDEAIRIIEDSLNEVKRVRRDSL
ncbi:MAG: aspartate aminotransferase family protein [Candidatus Korarchaeum sp.]|jgi:4-aminobutyrate aminotransferase|nr:aspartate aminotransferase family protein [Candidatus Korarchaeum sp.]